MRVNLKRVAYGEGLPLPAYQSAGAAGCDLLAAIDPTLDSLVITAGERRLVPCGIAIALPEGYEAQIRSRSGLALKKGVAVLNAPGTIDSDYRGELAALLYNSGEDAFVVRRGDRIAQMIIAPVTRVQFDEVAQLDTTTRGENGYGSTGVRATRPDLHAARDKSA